MLTTLIFLFFFIVAEVNDPEFVKDIDINDQRNRYLLTKGPTQAEVIHSFDSRNSTILADLLFLCLRFKQKRVVLSLPKGNGECSLFLSPEHLSCLLILFSLPCPQVS